MEYATGLKQMLTTRNGLGSFDSLRQCENMFKHFFDAIIREKIVNYTL